MEDKKMFVLKLVFTGVSALATMGLTYVEYKCPNKLAEAIKNVVTAGKK